MKSIITLLLIISTLSLTSKLGIKLTKQNDNEDNYYQNEQQRIDYNSNEDEKKNSEYLPLNLPKYLEENDNDYLYDDVNYDDYYDYDYEDYPLSEDYYYDQDNYFGLPEEYYSGDYDSQEYSQPEDNYYYFDDGQDFQSYYDQQEIQEPFKFY